jgi:hypothetical protein
MKAFTRLARHWLHRYMGFLSLIRDDLRRGAELLHGNLVRLTVALYRPRADYALLVQTTSSNSVEF